MKSEDAAYFLKWCNRYPWIVDHKEKIYLDIDHKVCKYNPSTWTYMFRSKESKEKFNKIISEAN